MAEIERHDLQIERHDIQGLLASGYGHLPCARYLLVRFPDDPAAARRWLGRLASEVTTAAKKEEVCSINVALTYGGLERIGLARAALATFPRAFREGIATEHRSRILGDRGDSDPATWQWGGKDDIDVLLLVFAADELTLARELERRRREIAESRAFEVKELRAERQPDNHEHFGFADGLSQPEIEGLATSTSTNGSPRLKTGEFILGFADESGFRADGPTVELADDPMLRLRAAPSRPARLRDLGRNGTYLVFRQLSQQVAAFWKFLDDVTRHADGSADAAARDRLAAKLVGRWKSGAPVVKSPERDDESLQQDNEFGYRATDARGLACPIGAHIRRANPRDSLGPDAESGLRSANRHRLLRRGRMYGARIADPLIEDGVERGLHFICLNSDLERQFEFVQQTWIGSPVFGGLTGEVDPLVGHTGKGDGFVSIPAEPFRLRVHGLRRFVTVRGGEYFFLPAIRALEYLATLVSPAS